ncbi:MULTISPECIES: amidohydrolase family protein [Actinokineospora]|uniref:Hydrolase n=1 Tax=Actinokineospora fastidiosa TaxID=1816 RepID=A0A918LGK2_9PSEU|nr:MULTISPECIES: amidohydrolase family protein [Actinokineospora]UVS77292.1 putative metal-dependent hydrolase of the TIM-barrel fold protein [Actinokineospora sp. UTMC 2448]GGS44310.1 hydrolase [Actinokineospora fastidiosa]
MRDADVAAWVRGLGVPGLVDIHVHFLPDAVQRKVWAYFDQAGANYGTEWPIQYRLPAAERVEVLRSLGVVAFAPLVYPHKPGMAEWLTDWVRDFAADTPGAVPTATLYPEPSVTSYLDAALRTGIRCVKAHVQVGAYDPRSELLDAAWGMLADAGVPVVVHCGHGPLRGEHTGLDVFNEVLVRHPRLTAVLAHAGMPEISQALDLVAAYPNVHIDTTMVGVGFTTRMSPLPTDWLDRLAAYPDRVAFGTDFPSIPYAYAEQVAAVASWAQDRRLGEPFLRAVLHDTPARLLRL